MPPSRRSCAFPTTPRPMTAAFTSAIRGPGIHYAQFLTPGHEDAETPVPGHQVAALLQLAQLVRRGAFRHAHNQRLARLDDGDALAQQYADFIRGKGTGSHSRLLIARRRRTGPG